MKRDRDSLLRLIAFALLLNAALLGVRCSSSSDLSVVEADSPELLARVDALEDGLNGVRSVPPVDTSEILVRVAALEASVTTLTQTVSGMQELVTGLTEDVDANGAAIAGLQEVQSSIQDEITALGNAGQVYGKDVVLYSKRIAIGGTASFLPGANCGRWYSADDNFIARADDLVGGEISEVDGLLHFSTDHESDLQVTVQVPYSERQNCIYINTGESLPGEIAWSGSSFCSWSRNGNAIGTGHPVTRHFILKDVPAGDYTISSSLQMYLGCGGERDLYREAVYPFLVIKYLN